jgi:hypothetical protein
VLDLQRCVETFLGLVVLLFLQLEASGRNVERRRLAAGIGQQLMSKRLLCELYDRESSIKELVSQRKLPTLKVPPTALDLIKRSVD